MSSNLSRKKAIHRYLHGQILAEETNTEYLGITITDMTWNTHVEQTAAEGNKKLVFPKRNLKINNPDIKSRAYKTLVRPTLKYCSTVWDPHTAKAALQLEMVQCWAARWVKNDYVQQSSVTQMLNKYCNIQSLKTLSYLSLVQRYRPQVAELGPEANRSTQDSHWCTKWCTK